MSTKSVQNTDFQNDSKFSVSQASSYLKITPSTLRRLENEGKVKSERLENGYRQYSFGDLVALKNLLDQRKDTRETKNLGGESPPSLSRTAVGGQETRHDNHKNKVNTPSLPINHIKVLRKLAHAGLALCLVLSFFVTAKFLGFNPTARIRAGLWSAKTQQARQPNASTLYAYANDVLGEESRFESETFSVNIKSLFNRFAEFKDGLTTNNATTGNLTVGSMLGLQSVDTVTENSLEKFLDISGDVNSPATGGLSNVVVSKINGVSFGDIKPESGFILMGDGKLWQSMSTEEITTLGAIETGTWNADPIQTGFGGTGLTAYAVGDLLYANSSSTLLQLNIGTANQILSSVGGVPKWVELPAVSGVTGTGVAGYLSYWDTTTNITNTTGMYWDVTNSRLGIGTTAPAQALTVVGDGSFTTNLDIGGALTAQNIDTGQGAYEIQDSTTLLKGMASFSSANFTVTNGAVSVATGGIGPTELASTAVTAGSYGSGTAIPNFTVDSDGRITDAGQTDISLKLLPTGTEGQTLYNNNGTWTALSSLFWNDTNSRLGIGTTNPENRLEVVGNIRSSAKVIAGDLTLGYGNYSSYFNGTAKVENSDEYLYFTSSYGSNVAMDPENGNLTGYAWLQDLGWVDFGTTDNDSGPVTVNLITGAVTGKAQIVNTGGYLDFNATPYGSDVVYSTSTHAFTGYVWSEDLGWINFGDTGVSYGDPPKITTSATNQDLLIDPNGTGSIYFHGDTYKLTSTGDLTVNDIYMQGYLGIGTTNPLYALDVAGAGRFTGDLHLTGALYDSADSAGTAGQYLKSTATGTAWATLTPGLETLPSGLEGQTLYYNANTGLWTANSTLFYDDTNARVGVGTTAPSTLLSLASSTYTFTGSGLSFGDLDTGLYELADDTLAFRIAGADSVVINSLGYLGIGTTNPTYPLTVGGDESVIANDTGNLTITPASNLIINNGSVGIGTTSPNYALDVTGGDIYTSGDLRIAGDDIFMSTNTAGYLLLADGTNFNPTPITGDISIDGNGQVTIAQNSVVLGTDTTGNYVATLADAGGGLMTVNNSGTETANVTLTITANSLDFSQFKDALSLDASTSITADNAEVLSIINTGTGASLLVYDEAGDATPFMIDASGNVGIGTTAPLAKIDVNGVGAFGIGVVGAPGIAFRTDLDTGLWSSGDNTLNLSTGAIEAMRISSAGFVGIGTTAPTYPLSVGGDSALIANDTGNLTITPASNLVINNGNVGIGTTSPQATLDVVGNVKVGTLASSSSNSVITENAGILEKRTADAKIWGVALVDYTGTPTAGYATYWSDADTLASEQYLSLSRGGTGIGSTNPANGSLLIGNGTGYSLGTLTAGTGIGITNASGAITIVNTVVDTNTTYTAGNGLTLASTTFKLGGEITEATRLYDSSHELLYINPSNGYLGIGTTSPAYKLDVNGDIRIASGSKLIGATQSFIDTNRHGFLNQTETSMSFDGTKIFTLADAGSGWSYYRSGIKYTITGNKTIDLTTVDNPLVDGTTYYIYIDSTTGALSAASSSWTLNDTKVPVATVLWNNTLTPKYQLAEERHTVLIDRRTHYWQHFLVGAKAVVAGAIDPASYALNTDTNVSKTFSIAQTTFADEDLVQTLSALPDPNGTAEDYVVFYRTGASTWAWKNSNMPFVYNVGNTNDRIQYDNNGTMTDSIANRWYNSYVLFTNFQGSARYVVIPGRNVFTSLANAQAEAPSSFSFAGFPVQEAQIAYRITWTTTNSTSQGKCRLAATPQSINLSAISTVSSGSSVDHNSLAGLQGGASNEYYHLTSAQQLGLTTVGAGYVPYATSEGVLGNSSIFETGGSIGIGTTSPGEKLEIVGNLKFSGTDPNVSTTTGFDFDLGDSAGSYNFDIRNSGDVNLLSINSLGGLILDGTTGSSGVFNFAPTTTTDAFTINKSGAGTGAVFRVNDAGAGDTSPFIITSTGLVGIGTTAPGNLLEIVGTSNHLSLTYDADNYNVFSVASDGTLSHINNGTTVATYSESTINFNVPSSFNVVGDVNMAYNLVMENPVSSAISFAGAGTVATTSPTDNLNLTLSAANLGTVFVDDTLTLSGVVQPATDSTSAITFQSALGADILSIDTTNGWVGVGTTSPAAKLTIARDFAGSGVTGYGFNVIATDSTNNANTDYGVYSSLALTGNAAKTGVGLYSSLSTASSTADSLIGADITTSTSGIITTGTRSIYGIRSQPASTGASTGGTTNVYGGYFKAGGTVGTGGTINSYGLYIANGTMNTTGTTKNIGLYVESPTGATTNYAAIFAGGNVGIGTATPLALLDVNGVGAFGLGTVSAPGIAFRTDLDTGLWSSGDNTLNLSTGATEAMRISSAGFVGIGTTAPTYPLSVGGDSALIANDTGNLTITPASNLIISSGSVGVGTTAPGAKLEVVGGEVRIATLASANYNVCVDANGELFESATACAGSDIRLKENVKSLSSALEGVLALNPVTFNWKDKQESGSQLEVGFIAQEMEKIFPQVVRTNPDGFKGIKYDVFSVVLTKAIQEQELKISGMDDFMMQTNQTLEALSTTQEENSRQIAQIQSLLDVLGIQDPSQSSESSESSQSVGLAGILNVNLLNSLQTMYDNIVQLVEALGLKQVDGELVVESPMTVLGDASFADVNISGDLMVGLLEVNSLENSINVIGPSCVGAENDEEKLTLNNELCQSQTIYLQKNLAGNINMFNGAIVFSPNGNITAGEIDAKKLVAQVYGINSIGQSVGEGVIPAGETNIVITSSTAQSNYKVFVTATSNTGGVELFVKEKSQGDFVVALSGISATDIKFDWWVVRVD